jgi:hypothetical protein
VRDLRRRGWIEDPPAIVDGWRDRVTHFRNNKEVLKLRIHPYERVPDVLDAASREAILQMDRVLSGQLELKRKLGGTKNVVARFLKEELSMSELDNELEDLLESAAEMLEENAGAG